MIKNNLYKRSTLGVLLLTLGSYFNSCTKDDELEVITSCFLIESHAHLGSDSLLTTFDYDADTNLVREHNQFNNGGGASTVYEVHRSNGKIDSITQNQADEPVFYQRFYFEYEGTQIKKIWKSIKENSHLESDIVASWELFYNGNRLSKVGNYGGRFSSKSSDMSLEYSGSDVTRIELSTGSTLGINYTRFVSPYYSMQSDDKVAFFIMKRDVFDPSYINYLSTHFVNYYEDEFGQSIPYVGTTGNNQNYVSSYMVVNGSDSIQYDLVYYCN